MTRIHLSINPITGSSEYFLLTTFEGIGAQIKLEREQIKRGLEKLHNNTHQLEDKSYASASVYGVASIEQLLPLLVERIKETHLRIKKGTAGVNFKEIKPFLDELDAESASVIASKVTFDITFSLKQKANLAANVTSSIGLAIENECMMRHYERKCPGLLYTLQKNYWHKSIGTNQKVVVIRTLMNRYNVDRWVPWGRANRVRLGGWLLDCICKVSGWFTLHTRQEGKKRVNYVIPTPEFMAIKDSVMAQAELFSPIAWPMIVPPNDWQPDGTGGGYILNEISDTYEMVRRGNRQCIQGETPVAFLNHIQQTSFTINKFIVDVAKTLQQRGIAVGKFVPVIEMPLPPKPVDIADNKISRKDYRRRAAEVMNTNAQAFKRSCRTRMTMNAVEVFEKYEKFWIPWSFDYRGRCYAIPSFLSPQGDDFSKSLLLFHEQALMTTEAENYLAFEVSTTYGNSKLSMTDRVIWTLENHQLITNVATDPIGNLSTWEGADEPWRFLAACEAYYHSVILCDRNYTNLPVAIDATASGLQVLSGLCRCESTAKLVNVIPSDKPQDAYQVIADTCIDSIPEHIKPVWNRKKTKKTVMTIPYNSKPFSNRSYIKEALKEDGIDVDKEELTQIVKAVRAAMNEKFEGPMQVMRWIEEEVSKAIDRGVKKLTWTTPSGFVVTQRLMKKQVERVRLQLLGECNIFVATGDTNEVDKLHHLNATSPNLIHSLDASLLCLSAIRFNAPLALIHDSILCRATDVGTLSAIVRETYMHLFAEQDYLTSWAKQIGAETEPPIIGTLNPKSVINSTYFFC